MITQNKIQEWLREVEERPASAAIILQFIANRLQELAQRNEELLAENISLRLEKKVEEYENRISNLEYQLELLKRQLGGRTFEVGEEAVPAAPPVVVSVLVYNARGQVLRVDREASSLADQPLLASLPAGPDLQEIPVRLLATRPEEELLFAFDSGRTVTLPVAAVPPAQAGSLDWSRAYSEEPRGKEELAAVLPIAKMSLFEACLQTSRRGLVKKMKESLFENYIANGYIGTGVKQAPDQTCSLTLCRAGDLFTLVSKDGYLLSVPVDQLPQAIEEVVRLGPGDYITAAFAQGQKPDLVVVTQDGKVLHREAAWLEPAASFKTRGQALFSQRKRAEGVRVAGAAAVDEQDWGLSLSSAGSLRAHAMREVFGSGSLSPENGAQVISFTTYEPG